MNAAELLPREDEIELFTPDWRMSAPALKALAELLVKKRPRTILETGPGLSTLVFLRYQAMLSGEVEYTIVDQPGPYHDKLLRAADSLLAHNELVHLVTTNLTAEGYYDVTQLPSYPATYDFISLDGPASSLARNSVMALAMLNERVTSHSCLVVDDTHRAAENSLVEWLQQVRVKRYGVEFVKDVISDDRYPRSTTFLSPPVL